MPGLGGTAAAILNIQVRTDVTRAQAEIRRFESTMKGTTRTAQQVAAAQSRAGASFRTVAQQMGMTERQARRLATANRTLATSNKNVDSSNRTVATSLKGVGKAAAGAAVAYVGLGAAKEAVSTTEDLAKATLVLHRNLGLSAKAAGGLGAEAKARGIDYTRLTMATKTYANAVEGAKNGGATQIEQFKNLGISVKELRSMNADQLLLAIADGATALGNTTEKTKALGLIFGRAFGPLAPLFRQGSAGLRDFIKANTEAGANLGAKGGGIKGVQDLIATQRELKRTSQGLQVEFTKTFGPPLIWLMKAAIKYLGVLRGVWGKLGEAAVRLAGWYSNAFHAIIDAAKNVIHWFSNAWANLGDILAAPFEWAFGKIKGFLNDIIGAINTVLGPVGVHLGSVGGGGGTSTAGTGKQGRPHSHVVEDHSRVGPKFNKKRLGGTMVPGSGSGDKIPAMLEPGEFVLNRKAVAAAGQANLEKFNKAVPRFARGGLASTNPASVGKGHPGTSGGGLPGVGGLPGWLQPAGQFVLDKVGGFIKSKLASLVPNVGGDILNTKSGAATLKSLQSSHPELQPGITQVLAAVLANNGGLSITSTTGGTHVPGSYHYSGRAVDIGGSSGAMSSASTWIKSSGLYKSLAEGIHNPNLAVSGGHIFSGAGPFGDVWAEHLNHIHLARQKGGVIGDFARAIVDTKAPHDAALALMMAGYAESGMRDLGYGDASSQGALQLLASTASSMGLDPHDEYGVAKAFLTRGYWGKGSGIGLSGSTSPAMIAHLVQGNATGSGVYSSQRGSAVAALRSAGLKWDKNGIPRIGDAVTSKIPKAKGKKKGKGAKTPSGNADTITEAYNALIEQYQGRAGSANELIGAGNLEAMQRYQVGAAQNPLLGLGLPGLPVPGDLMPDYPDANTLLGYLTQSTPGGAPKSGPNAGKKKTGPAITSHGIVHHTHVHVDGKEIAHVVADLNRKASRRGNRPLPGAWAR